MERLSFKQQYLGTKANERFRDSPIFIPSRVRMFAEWNEAYPPRDSDPPYGPFTKPASHNLPLFVQGLGTHRSRHLQSAGMQIITGHSFQADYSDRFCQGANDNTRCTHCKWRFTLTHALRHCPALAEVRGDTIANLPLSHLLSTSEGVAALCRFLHYSQVLLRPLPPRPDPP